MSKHFQEGNNIVSTDSATVFRISNATNNAVPFNVDSVNSRVGIGTATPGSTLSVMGSFAGTSLASVQRLNVAGYLASSGIISASTVSLTGPFRIPTGANQYTGLATLDSGAVMVSTTAVTGDSLIFLTPQSQNANTGSVQAVSLASGVRFGIKSTDAADSNRVAYLIIN